MSAENQKSDRLNQYFCSSRTRKDLWNTIKSKTSNLKSTEDNIITKKEENHDELGRLISELGEISTTGHFQERQQSTGLKIIQKQ